MSDTQRTDAVEAECEGWDKLRWIPQSVARKAFAHARQLERENAAMRWALENILARIDEDEWIPTEYVQQAREALNLS